MTDFDLNAGAIAPVSDEVTLTDGITIGGRIPDELNGVLIRNGPNPHSGRFSGSSMLDWWTGPGMVHGVAISAGRVAWYRNRWTTRPTHPSVDTAVPANVPNVPNVANVNVNVIGFGGDILALGEGDVPVRLDRMLTPIGPTTFGGRLPNGMMAHPKPDPATGELRFFRADWQPPYLVVGSIDPEGTVTDLRTVDLERPVMMHDFAITEYFDIMLDLGVGLDPSLLSTGVPLPLRWLDDHRCRLGVIPRDGSAPRWFEIESCFIQHTVNAFESTTDGGGRSVILDAVRYPYFLRFDEQRSQHLPNPLGVLWRFELDLATGSVRETQLDDMAIELPRIDERFTGRQHEHLYAVEQPTDREMRGLRRYELATGSITSFDVEPQDQNSEAVFVPTGAGQGHGLLLCCRYRSGTDTTDVVVLDAEDPAAPAIATIELPRRIPAGFHGAWVPF